MADPTVPQQPGSPAAGNSLFQSLNASLGQAAQPQGVQGGQTQQLQKLSAAASGKALGAGGPRLDNTEERQQLSQASLAQKALQGQASLDQAQLQQQQSQQQQEYQQQGQQLSEKALNVKQQFQEQAQGIINDYSRSGQQLDMQKDAARMEQLGFTMRLSNEKYVDQLQAEGARARLDNSTVFNEALQQSIFSDSTDLLNRDLTFKSALGADQRTFEKSMSDMDIGQAILISQISATAANQQTFWSGVSGVVSGGAQAGAMMASKMQTPAATPNTSVSTITPESGGGGTGGIGSQ